MATMLGLTSFLALVALAQTPAPLLSHTFSSGDEGWQGMGEIAKVSRTAPPKPTLSFEYMVNKTNLNALVRMIEPDSLKGAQRLHFALKTDTDTVLAFMVQEKGGGRFMAVATLPKNIWQEIDLAVSDLSLARDAGDPADTNGKLDTEKIESITIVDLHEFLIRMDGAAVTTLFPDISSGPRELWLREFTASTAPLPASSLDGLSRPQLSWIGVGGAGLKRVAAGGPLTGTNLEVTYSVAPGKFSGLFHAIPTGSLAGKASLGVSLAVAKSASLMVQLEDDQGGKFNAMVEVPGVRSPRKISLPWSDFKPADDSKRDKMDVARVKQIMILDISGITESVQQNNTLWLANLEAK
jgi:hypothetical protein